MSEVRTGSQIYQIFGPTLSILGISNKPDSVPLSPQLDIPWRLQAEATPEAATLQERMLIGQWSEHVITAGNDTGANAQVDEGRLSRVD